MKNNKLEKVKKLVSTGKIVVLFLRVLLTVLLIAGFVWFLKNGLAALIQGIIENLSQPLP